MKKNQSRIMKILIVVVIIVAVIGCFEVYHYYKCKCQYKNAQKVENKNVHFPTILPRIVFPKRLAFP